MALHYIDNLDAKIEMFRRGYETGQSLAERVTQRVRPLPANLVTPLPPLPRIETPPEPAAAEAEAPAAVDPDDGASPPATGAQAPGLSTLA